MDWRALRQKIRLGTVLGVVVALYVAIYLVQTIRHNYQLQKQIGELNQQVDQLKDETETLKYQIQYYQTDAYKEKQARAKLGLQAPGEGVVIVPHKDKPVDTAPKKTAPKKSNWQSWIDFLKGQGA